MSNTSPNLDGTTQDGSRTATTTATAATTRAASIADPPIVPGSATWEQQAQATAKAYDALRNDPNTEPDDPILAAFGKMAAQIEGLKGDARHAYDDLEFYSRWVMAEGSNFAANSNYLRRIYHSLQYDDERHWLVIGPRQSAKSTACTMTYSTWTVGRNPLHRFLLCFASAETQGKPFSHQLDSIITGNQRYIEIFGMLKPANSAEGRWNDMEKTVRRNEPPSGLKDPTYRIVGLGSSIPSARCDTLICDDLVTAANAYSETERARVISFVLQTLFPICVPVTGKRIIVGSLWHPADLYSHLAKTWGLADQIPEQDVDINELLEMFA